MLRGQPLSEAMMEDMAMTIAYACRLRNRALPSWFAPYHDGATHTLRDFLYAYRALDPTQYAAFETFIGRSYNEAYAAGVQVSWVRRAEHLLSQRLEH